MEKNQNPNTWSDLPLDLLNLVFKRLSFANFRRAKSVCSSWYSASRQCVPKNQIPWLMLFPKDKNSNSCTFFNPEDKEMFYKTQDLGVEFAKSVCIATYGSWLLMQDSKYNLYILNPFTCERIDLPAIESQQVGMECFHACVAGCGYKFDVEAEIVNKVKPKRPPPPPPQKPMQPPTEDVPATSA